MLGFSYGVKNKSSGYQKSTNVQFFLSYELENNVLVGWLWLLQIDADYCPLICKNFSHLISISFPF